MNTKVTIEMPFLFNERISTKPGKPVIPISMGTVTKRSTSSGDLPGASVATCTWTLVTSGKASTDNFLTAIKPTNSITVAITATKMRCCSARRTIFSIILAAAQLSFAFCIEVVGAFDHNHLSCFYS